MSTELVRTSSQDLVRASNPEAEVEWASRCAKALMSAIDSNPQLKVRISNRDYLKVEAWQTIGAMAKVDHVSTVWCREYTPPGQTQPIGWEARVEVLDRDGNVRGSGEAMCVRTEKTWANRDEFAIRSMAQTRAMGKAYRMALAFIVSLAGFEPTPAEEMPETKPAPPPPSPEPPPIAASAKQIADILDLEQRLTDAGAMTLAQFSSGLKKYGVSAVAELNREQAAELLERLMAGKRALLAASTTEPSAENGEESPYKAPPGALDNAA